MVKGMLSNPWLVYTSFVSSLPGVPSQPQRWLVDMDPRYWAKSTRRQLRLLPKSRGDTEYLLFLY